MYLHGKIIRQIGIGYLLVVAVCAAFSVYTYHDYIDGGTHLIQTHASIIANDLWQFDESGVAAYLELAAEANHYKSFKVIELSGNMFLFIKGPQLKGLDSLLVRIGLIPVHLFKADIVYNGQEIGVLRGEQYLRFIYPCFNFLIFLLLIMFVTLFVTHLFSSRKTLEHQVVDNTRRYQESERRFHDLVTMLPEMVWEADTEGMLTFANRIAFERFGFAETDMYEKGINLLDLIIPEERERAKENYEATLNGKKLALNEYTALTKDGRSFPIHIRSAPIYKDGKLTGARGVVIDVTELRKLENQLRQAQKMEAIGTLAGGIAHDFNNILTAIIGYTQLVQMELQDRPGLNAKLNEAYTAATRAKNLVQQILTFSRKAEHSKRPLKLSSVVTETVKLIRSSIPSTIEIKQEILTSETIVADATRMHQMVMNLCTNAYQAMEQKGGILSIRLIETCRCAPIGSKHEGEERAYLKLEISDTGCGIDLNNMDKIFDPYFTTKETGEGTGLGLSMVHGIVEEHGGFIEVESLPGKGTTFSIFLPVFAMKLRGEQSKTTHDSPVPAGGSECIMIVDDENQILDITRDYLQRMGYSIKIFNDPVRAMDEFNNEPDRYRLIITDQTMPHKTGAELCTYIKRIRPNCPVILCSGYSAIINRNVLKDAGINIFLQKPVVLEDLARAVRRLLDSVGNKEQDKPA